MAEDQHLEESMDNREFLTIGVQKMDPNLYKAAMEGDMKLLTSIAEANETPAPNLTLCLTPRKNTPLHIAVEYGHQDIVEKVIRLCPSLISQPNSKGDTPLHVAARAGNLDLTKLLAPALNLTGGNLALEEGNPVRQAGGVALRMRNFEGSNPIHEALKKSHGEVALHLLAFEEGHHELARDVNKAEESLLYLAAEAGLDEVVQKIIDSGDYSTSGPDGQNPLHIAVIKVQLGVVKILLDKERFFIPQTDRFGNTALHYASAESCRRVHQDEDEDKQRYWNRHIESLQTERHIQIQILRLLLEADPSPAYVPNSNGDYPLFIAIRSQFFQAVRIILDECPDSAELVNRKGQNALHLIVMQKTTDKFWMVLNRSEIKKLINETDNDGNTPMHLATLTNQQDIVKGLISGGPPDLTMSNNEGLTAMDLCGYTETEHPIRDTLRKFRAVPGRHRWQEQFPPLPPPPRPRSPIKGPPPPAKPRLEPKQTSEVPPPPRPTTPTPPPIKGPPSPPHPETPPRSQTPMIVSREFKKLGLQTLPIVTSLVATITFAAAFTVPGGYKNDGPREGLPVFMKSGALQAFVLSDVFAFCSSMTATILLIYANARSEDAFKINYVLNICYYISGVAIFATITTFLTAVYVLTSKESLWLLVTSLLLGSAIPLFLVGYRCFLEYRRGPDSWFGSPGRSSGTFFPRCGWLRRCFCF